MTFKVLTKQVELVFVCMYVLYVHRYVSVFVCTYSLYIRLYSILLTTYIIYKPMYYLL